MPPRAAPGDRAALERVLRSDPVLWAALQRLRELHDLHDWQTAPTGPLFQQTAVVLLAAELVASRGLSESRAREEAAIALGLSEETAKRRAKDWPRDSRRRVGNRPGDSDTPLYRSRAVQDSHGQESAA